MNILQFICPTGFYGAERWVLAIANNLDQADVRCDMAVTVEPHQGTLEIVKQYPDCTGKAFEIPTNGRFDFSAVNKLCNLIKEREIDVIHTHGYKSDILGLLAAKKAGIKCVSTPHGFGEAKDFKLKAYIRTGAFLLRFFDAVAPLSQQLFDECLGYGVPRNKLRYIQNGVDLKEVDHYLQSKQTKPSEIKTIGFIGQMIPRKKIDHILEIFANLSTQHDNLQLLFLGDGDSRAELEASAAQLPCSHTIKFLGFRQDRLEQLRDFDLFVMTSSSEGIPRCLMEALAMEIPVAAYNIPGIDQLMAHEQTGLLADYGDKETLQQYWETLLFDQAKAQQLAKAGRQYVLDNFSAARMAREYYDLFTQLLQQKQ
ncbi:glycosyltransferase family 4 protein [Dasania sp. GY-MA-18]|uniref:Glycosyltransferase family 4 protein n=1 Tax=Dasania phycosphaerae TaxID=2950436 RepID=A0A9J6RRJ8_9GAMM|nr:MULTISPECIES: glycosyltransferase family 4 protein [Dasania]MCR8924120.1 glycosyltransferase family 4 protein [Dasania sp. GY-MA-18]MCZ0866693.1 glycosyltransferase family 4 protein [Dasania phycosphaerae]MCZ0870278.1 glycosyltransferase family 4 protein [Dasania phycosphaerae]